MQRRKQLKGVRIIGGNLKRSKLEVLEREGLRPTPDRVRETLFNWLAPTISSATVVDCFAGTGSMGFEALSRGAKICTFIERDSTTSVAIKANIVRFDLTDRAKVITCNLSASTIKQLQEIRDADLIFADPPFHLRLGSQFLTWIRSQIQPNCRIIVECQSTENIETHGFEVLKELSAGQDYLRLLRPIL
ncbi:16S rRNA (guanine(966)-N(2))-methyltransferase RsmD [Litorivicinus sp.]|nr:16S rRNA (guanine(966)-N(2))-methyltransferase RsmD [Litorivicinus sp.]MDC1208921.1 16S rRNA (guanine(966)-N(2))-methyltransferase RsmD [Litorivicinus sp.]MDC1240442.1 16S rRNA (guanine(966)-N(2))-methyltransferase RsmD [Litorivicinus sp.]